MKDRERMQRGFDRLSPFYDTAAFIFFGRSLWRAQSHFLAQLPKCNNALIIGGGTGKILEEMIRLGIAGQYYYLDISGEMVKRARQRIEKKLSGKISSITFHTGTIRDIDPLLSFDLIVTPFVLDMIDAHDLGDEMKMIRDRMNKKGIWLFTDFNYPVNKSFSRAVSAALISLQYFFFRLFTGVRNRSLPGFEKKFSEMGFEVKEEKQFLSGILLTRLYHLKNTH